jgi:hypothetical protein
MNTFKKPGAFAATSVEDEICNSMSKLLTKNATENLLETTKISRAIDLVSTAADKLDRIKAWKEAGKLTRFLEILASQDCDSKLKSEIANEEKGLHETGTPFRRKDYKAEDHNNFEGAEAKDDLVIDEKDLDKVESMLKDFEDER